jgi:hypothetical protein
MLTTNQSEAPGWPFPAKVVFTGFGEEHRQYAGSHPSDHSPPIIGRSARPDPA